jgi:acetyl-CoA carboxylase biotin carboxyl carrier protein
MAELDLLDIKAPLAGRFFQSPKPDAEPYVRVGSRVATGQVVCLIEASLVLNEIESEVAGRVTEIAARDRQKVDFGQTLFRVDPHG